MGTVWVAEWVVGWSNLILYPTLALIRAQLGFRIQVGAECGINSDFDNISYKERAKEN